MTNTTTKNNRIPIGTAVSRTDDLSYKGMVVEVNDEGTYTCIFRRSTGEGYTFHVQEVETLAVLPDSEVVDLCSDQCAANALAFLKYERTKLGKAIEFLEGREA